MDERRWSARSDVFTRSSATALIVLPSEGAGLRLNGPAELIWALAHEASSTDEVAAAVADQFDEGVDQVRPFVVETLEQLHANGAVDVR